jgi:hypothetical protein
MTGKPDLTLSRRPCLRQLRRQMIVHLVYFQRSKLLGAQTSAENRNPNPIAWVCFLEEACGNERLHSVLEARVMVSAQAESK